MSKYGTVEEINVESDSLFQNEAVNTSYHGFTTKKLLTIVVAAMSGVAFFSAGYYKGLTKSFLGNNAMSMVNMVQPAPLGDSKCTPSGRNCMSVSYNPYKKYGDCVADCCSGEGEKIHQSQWTEYWTCK